MIVALAAHHSAAIEDFIADFQRAGEPRIPAFFCPYDDPIASMTLALSNQEKGVGLTATMVPATTRFFERDGALLGVINIRHRLNDGLREFGGHIGYAVRPSARRQGVATALLAFGLDEVRRHQEPRALLTCDPTNVGSVKTIVAAGGVLADTTFSAAHQRDVSRYWIPLSKDPSQPN